MKTIIGGAYIMHEKMNMSNTIIHTVNAAIGSSIIHKVVIVMIWIVEKDVDSALWCEIG
jgi:hypothetical protein